MIIFCAPDRNYYDISPDLLSLCPLRSLHRPQDRRDGAEVPEAGRPEAAEPPGARAQTEVGASAMKHGILKVIEESCAATVGSAPPLAIEHALSLMVMELNDAVNDLRGGEDGIEYRLFRLEAFALLVAARLDHSAQSKYEPSS